MVTGGRCPTAGRPRDRRGRDGTGRPELITADTLSPDRRSRCRLPAHRPPPVGGCVSRRPVPSTTTTSGPTSFDDVYQAIVDDVIAAALAGRAPRPGPEPGPRVVYAVPGSPTVAERTVSLLREHPAVVDGTVELVVHPAVSFLDLAFAGLGVDPVATGVKVVDGESFAVEAAGQSGPLLVAQCWSRSVLSAIKLSVESAPSDPVTVLHHLGLDDERILELAWDDLDRSFEPGPPHVIVDPPSGHPGRHRAGPTRRARPHAAATVPMGP